MGAAIQAFFTYPETAGKTLEEIEELFRKGGPRPWKTKPGGSLLDQRILDARESSHKRHGTLGTEDKVEYAEKNDNAESGAVV